LKQFQSLQTKLQTLDSQAFNDKALNDYGKRHGDINNDIGEMEKGLTTLKSPEEAASIVGQTKEMAQRKGLTVDQRTRLQQINQRATAAGNSIQATKTLQNSDDPQAVKTLGSLMVEGSMDPSQLSKRSKNYNQALLEANNYSLQKYGVPFNIAQASTDYKYANQRGTKDVLNMINGMSEKDGSIDIAQRAAQKLPKMDVTSLNKVFNATATQFGSDEQTNFHTAMLGLADEYSKVMGGGTGTDAGRQQGLDILKAGYSKGQIQGAIDIMTKDIDARRRAIVGKNRYLLQEYGTPQQQGAAQQSQPQGNQPQANANGGPPPQPAGTTHMQKPDGTYIYVPAGSVPAAQKLGAKVVQ
jgi:hypothetical protein